jgi:high-affinity Fe2+/Pb2+ permease
MKASEWVFLVMIIVSWFFGVYGLYRLVENLPFGIFLFFVGNIAVVFTFMLALYGLIKFIQETEKKDRKGRTNERRKEC